jgi:hypothetical protein
MPLCEHIWDYMRSVHVSFMNLEIIKVEIQTYHCFILWILYTRRTGIRENYLYERCIYEAVQTKFVSSCFELYCIFYEFSNFKNKQVYTSTTVTVFFTEATKQLGVSWFRGPWKRGKWVVAHRSVTAAAELAEGESGAVALIAGDVRWGGSSGRPLAGDSSGNVGRCGGAAQRARIAAERRAPTKDRGVVELELGDVRRREKMRKGGQWSGALYAQDGWKEQWCLCGRAASNHASALKYLPHTRVR